MTSNNEALTSSRNVHKYSRKKIIALTIVLWALVFLGISVQFATARAYNASQTSGFVIETFENDLNKRDSASALALFADTATVSDYSNIACLPGPPPFCPTYNVYTTTTQIEGWLDQLVKINVELKDVGSYRVNRNNVTWTFQVSVDEYRMLEIAPLEANANAVVTEGKIVTLAIELTPESTSKLSIAYAQKRASPYQIMANGVALGMIVVGLVFPAAGVYYVSRVKRLFATVPGLSKPWVILGAGVGSLFVSILLTALRYIDGLSSSIVGSTLDAVLVVSSFAVMSAVVLLKQVMISESDE